MSNTGGGLKLYNAQPGLLHCTTGWGASRTWPSGFYEAGYVTAGHCFQSWPPDLDRVTDLWNVGTNYVINPNA